MRERSDEDERLDGFEQEQKYSQMETDIKGKSESRRPNGFLGLSLKDRTILFLLIFLDKTVSVR